jgi:hydrophobic/amphiphilic exporter-1 (mainly G- bacteria), HAE1 family
VIFPGAGSELYRGLGSVLLGGLLVSTVVTLVLVPLLLGLCLRKPRPADSALSEPDEDADAAPSRLVGRPDPAVVAAT